ncbi:MAG: branched-chain alpha-keto acid dehydrogenase [Caudoviricetes sp.]|nr:MAG: branched-chain alpha-keto acid dehydrogenase [Caudoviricetes sp.]
MSKVEFTYGKGGRTVLMQRRYAETLRKLGHGTYPDEGSQVPLVQPPKTELLISDAVAEFAKKNGIDVTKVTGTGKDGRINKSDIEAVIKDQDLA